RLDPVAGIVVVAGGRGGREAGMFAVGLSWAVHDAGVAGARDAVGAVGRWRHAIDADVFHVVAHGLRVTRVPRVAVSVAAALAAVDGAIMRAHVARGARVGGAGIGVVALRRVVAAAGCRLVHAARE